jgi:hypothetical protein
VNKQKIPASFIILASWLNISTIHIYEIAEKTPQQQFETSMLRIDVVVILL